MAAASRAIDLLARAMNLGPGEIARRKEFLEFREEDVALLREIHTQLEAIHVDDVFADLFYYHLLSFPEMREFIPDEAALERLKAIQGQYFRRLTAGEYDAEYVLDRLRVGYVHQRVGLEPKWYTGAYRKYLSFLMASVAEFSGVQNERFLTTFDALLKVVFFDMELALDTYFQGDRQELLHQANHDALTGLPNRNLLADRIEQVIHQAHRDGGHFAILFLDLDRFKNINDSLGHPAGDRVIAEVAARLAASLREGDTVARLGGDEFAVVLSGLARDENIALIAEKLLLSITPPITIGEHELFVAGSIGIALYPADGETLEELLKNADTAMYRAKQEGNTFRFYQREMNRLAAVRLNMESRLRKALERGEFMLCYQPQVEIASGRITGVEALLRWNMAGELISPAAFIPLAEETGLIVPIGEWVLRTAGRQAAAWHKLIPDAPRVAVNLSARQLWRSDVAESVARILREVECDPRWIELEITESTMMTRPEEAAAKLGALAEMGIGIAIDDFGTGYSSLAYLKQLPINALKVDRSFIRDIASDPNDAAIVRAVIALAHSLELEVVGEGVEDDGQLSYIESLGCDLAQGYIFSEPVGADALSQMLQDAPFDLRRRERAERPGRPLNTIVRIDDNCSAKIVGPGLAVCLEPKPQCDYAAPVGNYCTHPAGKG